jgi:DNA-binding CsgD family transcriptional regulator
VRASLHSADFDNAFAEGAALSLAEAIALAAPQPWGPRRPTRGWASLTATEIQVVDLVGEGLTNPEVAHRMFLSPRTVQSHLSRAFRKLGVASRRELREAVSRRRES